MALDDDTIRGHRRVFVNLDERFTSAREKLE
jgi:hypothetical protein